MKANKNLTATFTDTSDNDPPGAAVPAVAEEVVVSTARHTDGEWCPSHPSRLEREPVRKWALFYPKVKRYLSGVSRPRQDGRNDDVKYPTSSVGVYVITI